MRKIVFNFNDIDKSESISERERIKSITVGVYEYIDEVMKSQKGKMGLGVHAIRREKKKQYQ